MLFARIITGWTGLIWFGYGLWLIYDPTQLSYMGMEFNHWSVTVEVFAMYGFVEAGLGIFAFLGAFRPQHYLRANVVLWLCGEGASYVTGQRIECDGGGPR